MRKVAVVMAVLLLFSCVPAAAAEETALTGVEACQQYGPWYTWTQEQKDSAVADWSEEFWYEYWAAYSTKVYADDELYYADLDAWNAAFYCHQRKQHRGGVYPDRQGRLWRGNGAEGRDFCGKDRRHACHHTSAGSGDPHPGRVSGLRRRIPDRCRLGTDEHHPVTKEKIRLPGREGGFFMRRVLME